MKIPLYQMFKISFIIVLLVRLFFPHHSVQFHLCPGSLPEADVPAQPHTVPVWRGDGPGQYSPGHRAHGSRSHFLPLQHDKVS